MSVKFSDLEMRLAGQILFGESRRMSVPKFISSPSEIQGQVAVLKLFMQTHYAKDVNFQDDQIQQVFDQAMENMIKWRIAEIRNDGNIELNAGTTASAASPKFMKLQNMAVQAVQAMQVGVKMVTSLVSRAESAKEGPAAEVSQAEPAAEEEAVDENCADWAEVQSGESPERDALEILNQWESTPSRVTEIAASVYVTYLKNEVLTTAIRLKL